MWEGIGLTKPEPILRLESRLWDLLWTASGRSAINFQEETVKTLSLILEDMSKLPAPTLVWFDKHARAFLFFEHLLA